MKIPFSRSIGLAFSFATFPRDWHFSYGRKVMIIAEKNMWKTMYLPIPVEGKTVLDVGAGEGESAWFFLEHGAKKVICVEPDKEAFEVLEMNAKKHREIVPVHKRFTPDDLLLSHDFMKMDVEGYEEELLEYSLLKPAIIEVHGLQLRDKFARQGYEIRYFGKDAGAGCTSYAYWRV